MKKKMFIVSDIHGYCTLLKEALKEAGFDEKNEEHLLICCGDYFDRGTENLEVLKFMERIKNKILLRGNHEDLLLEILQTGHLKPHNYINGSIETITEFFGKYALNEFGEIDFSGKTRMLERVEAFILSTQDYFETENYVFVHGWLPTVRRDGKPCIMPNWRKASKEKWIEARWTKWTDMYEVCDRFQGKTIICGHVPSFFANKFDKAREPMDASIFSSEDLIVIDAGTFTSGKLNVLVLEEEILRNF